MLAERLHMEPNTVKKRAKRARKKDTRSTGRPPIKVEEAVAELMKRPAIPVWPHVAALLGVGRMQAYALLRAGRFETINVGVSEEHPVIRVVSASLRKQLQIDAA